jgi:hypothetical protein
MEYIIQLDPQTLDALRAGSPIQSDLHPDAGKDVRSYRIIVGNAMLPREIPPIPTPKKPSPETNTGKEPQPPQKLSPNPAQKPMPGQAAVFEEPESKPSPAAKTEPAEPSKPWLVLTLTLFGLFASIGANIYLGWIAWESRRKYRAANGTAPASG